MAYRKITNIIILEPLQGTDGTTAATEYAADKSLIDGRFGVGGTYEGNWSSVVYDDNAKKITLTKIDEEFTPS